MRETDMTATAVTAWQGLRDQFDELLVDLSSAEWSAPSACAGWRVRDVVAHLAASARAPIDPPPDPPDAAPLPRNRERQHDVFVDRRRHWSIQEVVAEYRTYAPQFAAALSGLQDEPTASQPIPVPGLGVYPAHSLANANVFDYYCHLRHDILAPGGPITRPLPPPDHDTVYAAVQWMMLGLPQMQGEALDGTVTEPITIKLTGPGASEWTITRPEVGSGLHVTEGGGATVVVQSDAHAFIAWGTTRAAWREHCHITGPPGLAAPLLDALDIV
jgi:uncharacterized protein (TIGR03083 family)